MSVLIFKTLLVSYCTIFFFEFLENQTWGWSSETVPDTGESWFDGKEAINEEREANGLENNSSDGE